MPGTPVRLSISESFNIYQALPLKEKLLAALAETGDLELDLTAVSEIDTSGLQLLILAKREASRLGKSLRIVAHSEAVREVIEFTHLAAYFGDPLVIKAQPAQ